jgi:glutathione peroxidase
MQRRTVSDVSTPASSAGGISWTGSSDESSGEKGGKIRRQQKSQFQNALLFLGIMSLIFLVTIVKLRHGTKTHNSLLRSRVLNKQGIGSLDLDLVPPQHGSTFLPPNSIYKLSVEDATGQEVSLEKYAGIVTLVVNVACLWGKTKVTYEQLAVLQSKYQSKGFSVLAFPTNDFNQELGSNEQIQEYVSEHFPQVSFPVFGMTSLKDNPVYQTFQRQLPNAHVQHNFFKYLVDQNGVAVSMFHKKEDPLTLEEHIEKLLGPPVHRQVTE